MPPAGNECSSCSFLFLDLPFSLTICFACNTKEKKKVSLEDWEDLWVEAHDLNNFSYEQNIHLCWLMICVWFIPLWISVTIIQFLTLMFHSLLKGNNPLCDSSAAFSSTVTMSVVADFKRTQWEQTCLDCLQSPPNSNRWSYSFAKQESETGFPQALGKNKLNLPLISDLHSLDV